MVYLRSHNTLYSDYSIDNYAYIVYVVIITYCYNHFLQGKFVSFKMFIALSVLVASAHI